MRALKGHGTENDFVLVPDLDGELEIDPGTVAAICDRRAGLGGDGLIRVVRTRAVPEVADLAEDAEWFMDYRNADGSIAEMCGNGVRVFARYLADAGLVDPAAPLAVATRGGVRGVRFETDGQVTVGMGHAKLGVEVTVATEVGAWPAIEVHLPNPHAVAFVDDPATVGRLFEAPLVTPAGVFPEGVNVEFVATLGPGHIALRVHERGVGETRSCGTGVAASALAAARHEGPSAPAVWTVDVPGGRLTVTLHLDGEVELTGPAVLVATVDLDLAALGRQDTEPNPA